ncbi:MAG: hypothetical protein KQJ78_09720 [Deltaproteobacteria bacterium]|nr:hypothetical protein [Deltaproteobacteria bacterium]
MSSVPKTLPQMPPNVYKVPVPPILDLTRFHTADPTLKKALNAWMELREGTAAVLDEKA